MQRIILSIIILLCLSGSIVFAQEIELPASGLTPDSPFYFFDILFEKIAMFFTFGAEKKAEKALMFADEKLAEVIAMAQKGKAETLEKASKKYEEYLALAKEKGKDIERLVVLIAKRTLNHQQILADLLPGVPESAKSGMERAIQVSQHGSITVLEVLKKTSPEEIKEMRKIIPMEIRERAGLSLYPVFSEYFRTCFPTFSEAHREQILEGYQISEQLTEEETNKAMGIYAKGAEIWVLEKDLAELTEKERREIFKKFEKIGQITEDFERKLEKGETRKEWEDIFGCRDVVVNEELRPEDLKEICKERPSCCEWPEIKNEQAVKEIIEKLYACMPEEKKLVPEKIEVEKLEEGYKIKIEFWLSPTYKADYWLYMTDAGCGIPCDFIATAPINVKEWQKEKEKVRKPEILLKIIEVPVSYEMGYYTVRSIHFSYENVSRITLAEAAFDYLLVKNGKTIARQMDVEMPSIKAGDKGTLTGWMAAQLKEEGRYTVIIRVHRLGETEILGEAKKDILITKEKYGCRKGKCITLETPIWWANECQVEKCTCINCEDFAECWNAWTGKNCQSLQACRDLYGTNYREAGFNYVYKIDPTKKDRYSCLGVEEKYGTFRDGNFYVAYPLGWGKAETASKEELAAYSSWPFLEIIYKEDRISLQSYKEGFEAGVPYFPEGKLLESSIHDDRYAAILEYTEAGKKSRLWLVAINCGNYTYTVKFLWWEADEELPLRYAAIRNNIFDSIMCKRD